MKLCEMYRNAAWLRPGRRARHGRLCKYGTRSAERYARGTVVGAARRCTAGYTGAAGCPILVVGSTW
jgi:hypothetical protein